MARHDFDIRTQECRRCHAPRCAIEYRWVPDECVGLIAGKTGFMIVDEFAFFGGSTLADSDGDDGA